MITLPYTEKGAGTPVLMLHGWTDSQRSFEPVFPHLPSAVRAIAPTQRGHGDADRPADGYSPSDLAGDAVALLDSLGIDRAVLVGHSMGAWVAEQIAIEHPERVDGVVLVGAIGSTSTNPAVEEIRGIVAAMEDPVDPDFVHEFQLSTTERPLPPGLLDTFVQESLRLPARVWQATAERFPDDVYDAVAAIEAPTLLIWGDRDAVATRAEQQRLVEAIPQARLTVYEGTGHAVHWEEPERFAADVAAFAAEVAS
jgi:pimeloyl-ACP methyl ester carboxylesterase